MLLSVAGTLLAGCHDPTASEATTAAPPPNEGVEAAPSQAVGGHATPPPAAKGQAVPFVGRPNVGSAVRAADANAAAH